MESSEQLTHPLPDSWVKTYTIDGTEYCGCQMDYPVFKAKRCKSCYRQALPGWIILLKKWDKVCPQCEYRMKDAEGLCRTCAPRQPMTYTGGNISIDLPVEEMYDLYLDGWSLNDIGRMYNVSYNTVRVRFRDNGLKRRTRSEARKFI